MALLKPFTRPLSLDDAVEAVYQAALAGGAVIDAAREFGHQVDDRDIYELVVEGLAERAHRRLARQRSQAEENEQGGAGDRAAIEDAAGPVPAKAKPHAAKVGWAILRGNYEAADGTRKALLQFTLDDWRHMYTFHAGAAAGHARKRDAADRAISAMQEHKAKTTAGLPSAEKQAIAARLA